MGDAPASASSSSASAPSASSSSAAPQADPAAPQQHRSRQHRSHHHRHAQPSDAHNNSNNALRNLSAFAQTRNTGVGAGGGLGAFHDEEDEIMQLILMINAMDAMEALEGQQQQQQQVTSSSSSSSGPVAMAAPFAGAVSDTPGLESFSFIHSFFWVFRLKGVVLQQAIVKQFKRMVLVLVKARAAQVRILLHRQAKVVTLQTTTQLRRQHLQLHLQLSQVVKARLQLLLLQQMLEPSTTIVLGVTDHAHIIIGIIQLKVQTRMPMSTALIGSCERQIISMAHLS